MFIILGMNSGWVRTASSQYGSGDSRVCEIYVFSNSMNWKSMRYLKKNKGREIIYSWLQQYTPKDTIQ